MASTAATIASGTIGRSPVTALTGRLRPTASTAARTVSSGSAPSAPRAASLRSMMSAPCASAISASCGPDTLASISVMASLRLDLEQAIADQPIEGPRPGFVGVAAETHADRRHRAPSIGVTNVNAQVQDEVRDLVHHSGDGQLGAEASG